MALSSCLLLMGSVQIQHPTLFGSAVPTNDGKEGRAKECSVAWGWGTFASHALFGHFRMEDVVHLHFTGAILLMQMFVAVVPLFPCKLMEVMQ